MPIIDGLDDTFTVCFGQGHDNDPSAGSPTQTVLRLLLPVHDEGELPSRPGGRGRPPPAPAIRTLHRTIQSVGATGGVYKGQGRSQRELMSRAYQEILGQEQKMHRHITTP